MRYLTVILLLLSLAAVSGAVMGVVFLLVLTAVGAHWSGLDSQSVGLAAAVGAGVGALFGPPIALTFLRRVPLWRATTETAAVAGLGAAIGGLTPMPFGWLAGALLFAILGALRLRRVYGRAPAPAQAEGPGE